MKISPILITILLSTSCMQTNFPGVGDCYRKEVYGGKFVYGKVVKVESIVSSRILWDSGKETVEWDSTIRETMERISCR